MKINTAPVHLLDSNGVGDKADFKIAANAQSFRILSSGLYSDKISAVLREVGCNAADAHIAAGIPHRPIEVKLPNRLDSEFYIKDWGTGLNEADILGLYTTYFSSNKGGNNEQTGAFGLGSKSPFSYTDSFAVTSAHEGIETAYTAYIGPQGAPVISKLATRPVQPSWPTGIRVSFPVDPKDFNEFHQKSALIFRWFAVRPVAPGTTESSYQAPEFSLCGSNFGFLTCAGPTPKRGYGGGSTEPAFVLTGNVAYPLDANRLNCTMPLVTHLIGAGVHLRMPLGSVMPTASREELEYDERTRAQLVKALKAAAQELAGMLKARVDESNDTDWARHARARAFLCQLPSRIAAHLKDFLELLQLSDSELTALEKCYTETTRKLPTWAGAPTMISQSAVAEELKPYGSDARGYRVWLVERECGSHRPQSVRRHAVHQGYIQRGKHREAAALPYAGDVTVVSADAKHSYLRVKDYLFAGRDAALLIEPADESAKAGLSAYAEKLATELGGIAVVSAATLPYTPKAWPRTVKAASKSLPKAERERLYASETLRCFQGSPARVGVGDIAFKDVPPTAHYYLPAPVKRDPMLYEVRIDEATRSIEETHLPELLRAYQTLQALGVPVIPITGFVCPVGPQARKFKLKERGWKPLLETMAEQLKRPDVLSAVGERLNGYPNISTPYRGQRFRYRRAEETGFFGHLLDSAEEDAQLKQWLFALLRELPTMASIFTPFWDANVLDGDNQSSDRAWQLFLDDNLVAETFEAKRQDCETFLQSVLKVYPETRFLKDDHFAGLWKEDPAGAARVLKRIFAPGQAL